MNENRRTMTPEEYMEEFELTLTKKYENHTVDSLFKEFPVDIKYFRDKKNKPVYTQEAEFFLYKYSKKPKDYLERIQPINREEPYKLSSHDGKHDFREDGKCTTEKVEAKAIFNSFKENKGTLKIIDYEVPLRKSSKDKGIGEIDLVGQNGDEIYLLELKKFKDPNGDLFHMILQSYTYMKLLDLEKFKKEYKCSKVIPSILFFQDSENYKQFYDPRNDVFKNLLKHLGMKVFSVKNKDESYKNDKDIYVCENEEYPKLRGDAEIEEIKL